MHPYDAHQRRLWMRPDAERFMRPNAENFLLPDRSPWLRPVHPDERKYGRGAGAPRASAPGLSVEDEAELRALQTGLLELKALVSDLKLDLALRRLGRKYSPDQPRVPAGLREGGQWTNYVGGTLSRPRVGSGAPRSFSPGKPGWHNYKTGPNLVCRAELRCSHEEVADQLARFSIPGRDPSVPVEDRTTNKVYFPETRHHVGDVETEITDRGFTITNLTVPGHLFFDGTVIRSAHQGADGSWYVTTHGFGNNVTTGMNIPNQLFGPEIFRGLDREMRANIEWHHGKAFRFAPTRPPAPDRGSSFSRYRRRG